MKHEIRPGDTVKVHQILREKNSKGEIKERIQVFEGLVLARKHGKEPGSTITVRKVVDGIGVEKIYPLNSPLIKKIELVKRSKVRRAKLYFLRKATGKRGRLKTVKFFDKDEQPEQWEEKKEEAPVVEEVKEETTEVIEETKEETPTKEVSTEEIVEEKKEEAPVVEEVKEETTEVIEETKEETPTEEAKDDKENQ